MTLIELTLASLLGLQSVAWIATDLASRPTRPPARDGDPFGIAAVRAMRRTEN